VDIAQGLDYLHSLRIVHGDVKFVGSSDVYALSFNLIPVGIQTNVLIDANSHARLTDFGVSAIIAPSFAGESAASGNSARWMAPEFVADLDAEDTPGPTTKSDVYSFGRLVYAVRTGLFYNEHEN
jgi:serine/threonine protein kinase